MHSYRKYRVQNLENFSIDLVETFNLSPISVEYISNSGPSKQHFFRT